jgi:hypothetical protein
LLIYACISSHGFGHGSRTTSVLWELAALKPDWRLVLSTGLPEAFLTVSLGAVPFEHRPCRWDVGVLQADAFSGYNELYKPGRPPGAIVEAGCWAHARRKFFVLADLEAAERKKARGEKPQAVYPKALEAVRLIDALFAVERTVNGSASEERRAVRQASSAPIVAELETWLADTRSQITRGHDLAKAIHYLTARWPSFTRFLDDGRVCLSNNAAERALRGIALGRKAWLFCGSDRGGQRAAFMYSLMVTAKLNDVDPQAWLADVLGRINDLPSSRIDELLPWNWAASSAVVVQ